MKSSTKSPGGGGGEKLLEAVEQPDMLRLLVESVRDYAIILLDTKGNVTTWSPMAERMNGWATEEAVGKHFSMFYPLDAQDQPDKELAIAEKEGRFEDESWRMRKDGTRFWANTTITALRDETGILLGYGKITRDLTRQRTAELTAANKELEALSYSISHDLRAPLRHIDGFAQLLRDRYGAQLPPQAQGLVEKVCTSAQHLGQLIDDLLNFSRLNRQPINTRTVKTASLVQQVLDELQGEREGRQIDIRVGEFPDCRGDVTLLKQALFNLISNALKFTRKREHATIDIGCYEEPKELVIFVSDNGAGFDMAYADKLFGVFQRLHSANQFEGTGVGLSIVQRIIHRHGGRVWAKGEVNQGATFYFALPNQN